MEDVDIVQMFWDRNEDAISAADEKYRSYCYSISYNILHNRQDAEECVNDAYMKAWNAIPPNRPQVLSVFLGRIVRNLSFNRYQYLRADKRGGGEVDIVLDELAECLAAPQSVEGDMDRKELLLAINTFLEALAPQQRNLFVRRYWYADQVKEIAGRFGMTENHVSVTLSRLRRKLHDNLLKRGLEP